MLSAAVATAAVVATTDAVAAVASASSLEVVAAVAAAAEVIGAGLTACGTGALTATATSSALTIRSGLSKEPTPQRSPLCESLRWAEARRHVRERPVQRLQKTTQHLGGVRSSKRAKRKSSLGTLMGR
jgi:hypothetical protein